MAINSFHFIYGNQNPISSHRFDFALMRLFFSQIISSPFFFFISIRSIYIFFTLRSVNQMFSFHRMMIYTFVCIVKCRYLCCWAMTIRNVFATFLCTFQTKQTTTTIFLHSIVHVVQLQQIKCNQFSCCWLQLNENWQRVVCECNEANSEMLCFWDSSTNKNAPADFRWWWCCC